MEYCEQNEMETAISHICNCEYEYFLNKANVVGIGCGYKVTKGFHTNQLCIQVFTRKKLSKIQLNSQDIVPNLYKGFSTDVIESGNFISYSLVDKIRPVMCGYGIGNERNFDTFGTLGCLVTDGYYTYILSCNHVLANFNNAPIGTKIMQPNVHYCGNPKTDVIALLSKFIPIKYKGFIKSPSNYADCAIAKVIDKHLVNPRIDLVGIPKGTIVPKLDENVKKVGAITERTTGAIITINATIEIDCSDVGKVAVFKKQILTTLMSKSGDSGAVLLDKLNNGIGILTSGSQFHDSFSPIEYILKSLNVRLVTSTSPPENK